mgnify:CR=1 FL=1
MSHLDVRAFGRSYSLQGRDGCHPVNLDRWFDKEVLGDSGTLHALGPCVLYAGRGANDGRRVDLELGRFALSF